MQSMGVILNPCARKTISCPTEWKEYDYSKLLPVWACVQVLKVKTAFNFFFWVKNSLLLFKMKSGFNETYKMYTSVIIMKVKQHLEATSNLQHFAAYYSAWSN